jgi:hypothetical protein
MRQKCGLLERAKSYKFLLKQGFLDIESGLLSVADKISVFLDATPTGFFIAGLRKDRLPREKL